MENLFICLDCQYHSINHSTRTIDCKRPSHVKTSVFSCPYDKLPDYRFSKKEETDPRIEELVRLTHLITPLPAQITWGKAYRRNQELRRRIKEVNDELQKDISAKKQREEYAKSETIKYLTRLAISEKTAYNYSKAYSYVYRSIYNDKPLDSVAICYAVRWNTYELLNRESKKKEAGKLDKSILSVKSFLSANPYTDNPALCYVHSMTDGGGDGGPYYEGYAIVFVNVTEISSKHYLVLVYDKEQDNNGFSKESLTYRTICRYIDQHKCDDYRIVMKEKNSRTLEPIIRFFGQAGCYCLQCKTSLKIH